MTLISPSNALAQEELMMGRKCVLLDSTATRSKRGSTLTIIYSADSPSQSQTRVAVFTEDRIGSAWSGILNVKTLGLGGNA